MGLAVGVGSLSYLLVNDTEGAEWVEKDFDSLNRALKANGLPLHEEPKGLPELSSRSDCLSYPYSFLHCLRRFYARTRNEPDWIPTSVSEHEDPSEDESIEEEFNKFESHLVCHSDCEGYYLPIDFDDIIVSEDGDEIPGDILCSSYRLKEELVTIAPKLGIYLSSDKTLSDTEASKINQEVSDEGLFWIEKLVWLSLFEATRLSIEHKTAIRFG